MAVLIQQLGGAADISLMQSGMTHYTILTDKNTFISNFRYKGSPKRFCCFLIFVFFTCTNESGGNFMTFSTYNKNFSKNFLKFEFSKDKYRDQMRKRAVDLIEWILDTGDNRHGIKSRNFRIFFLENYDRF